MHHDLAELLRQRLSIIADHAFRDRDPAAHLAALQGISEKISTWIKDNRSACDPQLRHYLANSSFDKALAHLSADGTTAS